MSELTYRHIYTGKVGRACKECNRRNGRHSSTCSMFTPGQNRWNYPLLK